MQRHAIVDRRVGGDDSIFRADALSVLGFDDDTAVFFLHAHHGRVGEQPAVARLDAANETLQIPGWMERRLVRIAQGSARFSYPLSGTPLA